MAYPTFFLGEVPVLDPEAAETLTPEEAYQLGFQAGAEHATTHVYEYWQQRIVDTRGQISRIYTDVLKGRVDWLYRIFAGIEPNPTGSLD